LRPHLRVTGNFVELAISGIPENKISSRIS